MYAYINHGCLNVRAASKGHYNVPWTTIGFYRAIYGYN